MCLAEALLRIPDKATIDRLISDKISTAEWSEHLSANDSMFVNAATWSLMLTGKIYAPPLEGEKGLVTSLKRLLTRTGGTVIRPIIQQGMKIIGSDKKQGAKKGEKVLEGGKSKKEEPSKLVDQMENAITFYKDFYSKPNLDLTLIAFDPLNLL